MLNESFSVIFKYREYWKGQRAVYCWNWLQPWMKLLNQSYFSDFYRTTKTCWDSLIKIQLSHNSHNCIFMRVEEFLPTQDRVEFDMPSLKNEWMSCFIYTNGLNAVCNHPWLHQHKKCVSSSKRCLKVTEKVSFKIASEASYVYICQECSIWIVFENLKLSVKQYYQILNYSMLSLYCFDVCILYVLCMYRHSM